jgi:hypothetical protein
MWVGSSALQDATPLASRAARRGVAEDGEGQRPSGSEGGAPCRTRPRSRRAQRDAAWLKTARGNARA